MLYDYSEPCDPPLIVSVRADVEVTASHRPDFLISVIMSQSSEDIKKSKRGRPRNSTHPVMVRVTDDELATIDQWIADNGPPYVSRPEAIRRLVEKGLDAG